MTESIGCGAARARAAGPAGTPAAAGGRAAPHPPAASAGRPRPARAGGGRRGSPPARTDPGAAPTAPRPRTMLPIPASTRWSSRSSATGRSSRRARRRYAAASKPPAEQIGAEPEPHAAAPTSTRLVPAMTTSPAAVRSTWRPRPAPASASRTRPFMPRWTCRLRPSVAVHEQVLAARLDRGHVGAGERARGDVAGRPPGRSGAPPARASAPQARSTSRRCPFRNPCASSSRSASVPAIGSPSIRSGASRRARPRVDEIGQGRDRGLEQLGDRTSPGRGRRARRRAPAGRRRSRPTRRQPAPAAAPTPATAGWRRRGWRGRSPRARSPARRGRRSRTSRSRSTAVGAANWAPPSPSTK